jgi:hypothetical protein
LNQGEIERAFPKLQFADWRITSAADDSYNCIAWAANATDRWWWPDDAGIAFRPSGVQCAVTLPAFREAFETIGFAMCGDELLIPGIEKIAVFAKDDGIPTHAARQLADGTWTSKLGRMQDIEHALRDLEGPTYGSVAFIMSRATPAV